VEDGDRIALDVPGRRLTLEVDEATLARRRAARPPLVPPAARGPEKLHVERVLQADRGGAEMIARHRFALPKPRAMR
jgi:dihydroxy-acid dehydratase